MLSTRRLDFHSLLWEIARQLGRERISGQETATCLRWTGPGDDWWRMTAEVWTGNISLCLRPLHCRYLWSWRLGGVPTS